MAVVTDGAPETMAIAALNQRTSLLLKLPGELRNRIYGYVLGNPWWYVGSLRKKRDAEGNAYKVFVLYEKLLTGCYNTKSSTGPALLRVSRQIHTEAWLLFFSQSTFVAGEPTSLFSWIASLPNVARIAISSVSLGDVTIPARFHGTDMAVYVRDDFYPRSSLPRLEIDQEPTMSCLRDHAVLTTVGDLYGKFPGLKHLHLRVYWSYSIAMGRGNHQRLVTPLFGVGDKEVEAELCSELAKIFELPDVRVEID